MRNDITTIPLQDVFDPREGCPLCRLRDMLESRVVTYITGAAMMEPDVRTETNRAGFCHPHFEQLLGVKNRLGVALILQSHLDEQEKALFPRLGSGAKAADKLAHTCFVCDQIEWAFSRMTANIVRLYENDRAFRDLFGEQEALCVPHYARLLEASAGMNKRWRSEFAAAAETLCRGYLHTLREDVNHFTRMFDYRSRVGADGEPVTPDWGNSRDSLERAVWWLTGRGV